ncbi:Actin-related protein 5 [Echinococcus granulosus]|uniref:Actin protein 5 n=1 Tax=Echinococcus granulosus TaxID=6210 RepID=A0A068WNK7_ECHGR|nr:Actin-related protein 5 [Echinococcus granulosus]CDS20074.1 Actin protein 5 [Echinococcus granulosus]
MVVPAIVVDNGSFECRAGFSNKNEPMLQFRNVVMKSRSRMRETFVGSMDEMDFSQVNSKSPFEQNTVTQLDVQEIVFDHIFCNIGIESSGVNFPVILSEPLCCPQQSRSQITELLFETYSVNRLTYFVDGLASFYANFGTDSPAFNRDTMMLSFGYHTTHIIPFSNGTYIPSACRRLSVGGAHISWYFQQLLALKYPCHSDKFTIPIAEDLIRTFGKVCENYREEMQRWKDEAYKQENTRTWCIPYSDETQRKAQELAERRQFQADRLREIHRKRVMGRLKEQADSDESDTRSFDSDMKRDRLIDDVGESETDRSTPPLCDVETGEETVLQKLVNLRERKATELLSSFPYPAAVQAQMTTGPPTNAQGLNDQKLRRRLLAANDLEARRRDDFCLWLSQINNKRQRIAKQRTLRQSKVDLATELGLHSQEIMDDGKMAVISQNSITERKQRKIEKIRAMTSELKSERSSGGKRGVGRGAARKTIPRKDSNRSMAEITPTGDEESWLDEEVALESLDAFSEDVGGDFVEVGDGVPQQNTCPISPTFHFPAAVSSDGSQSRSRPRDAFEKLETEAADLSECERDQLAVLDCVRASYDPEFLKETGTVGLKINISEYYKVHLSTEPIRATEVLFERSLMGNTQAGVGECLTWVLRDASKYLYEDAAKPWVPRRLFLTGSPARLPGMEERLRLELQQLLPWKEGGNPLEVVVAADPSLDAWKGAQIWSQLASENDFREFTTKNVYDECGFDYLAENIISNRFYASFKDLEINPKFNPGRGRQPTTALKQQVQELQGCV